MIFYTLVGPKYTLEIHEEKLQLTKRSWASFLKKVDNSRNWEISRLSNFKVTKSFFFWGRVEWETLDGEKQTCRLSTNFLMMKKIEKYLQKRILKNLQGCSPPQKKESDLKNEIKFFLFPQRS